MRHITIVLLFFLLLSCNKNDGSNVEYPYTEHEIEYMGIKSGLTSSSSDAAFDNGLDEIIQQYAVDDPDALTGIMVDNVAYDITDLREMTGGIPISDWDLFWEDLGKYDHSVGSCWGFMSIHIPSKGRSGTVYFIYAIVTDEYDVEVRYVALQGAFTPAQTRSVSAENPLHFLTNGKYGGHYDAAKRSEK